MNHTPGPWFFNNNLGCKAIGPNTGCFGEQVGEAIADTVGIDPESEDLANATLMAAAPDLLEACEAWHSYSEHARLCDVKPQHHKSLGDVVCADCFKLEVTALKLGARAIAKAKGETIDE